MLVKDNMPWAIVLGGDLKLITSKNVRILGRKRLWEWRL